MKKFKIKQKYNCCRVCGISNKNLLRFFQVKNLPMPEGHVFINEQAYVHDLDIYWCNKCGMVQTQLDLDLDQYYKNYVYTTGSSQYVENYMRDFAINLFEKYLLNPNCLIVEVGSGDGVQLKKFKDLGCKVIGVEPSNLLVTIAKKNHIPTINKMFNKDAVKEILNNYGKAKAIIIQYTFDHLQQPAEFINDCFELLDDDGYLVIEVHDFEDIYQRNEACLFTHEHSIYPTYDSLNYLLNLYKMKIIGKDVVDKNKRRGNSIVIVAAKSLHKKKNLKHLSSQLSIKLKHKVSYDEFSQKVLIAHDKLKKYLLRKKKNGKKIAGYGAAGRGVDTAVLAKLDDKLLDCVYDMNKAFQGKRMPVSNIEVRNPKDLFADNPDELIVFSYGYIEEIKKLYKDHFVKIVSLLDLIE